uniref:Uncharacterized protein n=1 Tax=Klebsiella pneumoniae TaxID=573 RepID=A0A6G9HV59_KLEPN|nr:hypothetical protein [Klebsiella pneumoniae]QIQ14580.1 hypothetical protein [Klebsiella pneumoniae]
MKIQEKKYLALPHLLQGKEKGIVNLKNLAGGGIVCGLNADLTGICNDTTNCFYNQYGNIVFFQIQAEQEINQIASLACAWNFVYCFRK